MEERAYNQFEGTDGTASSSSLPWLADILAQSPSKWQKGHTILNRPNAHHLAEWTHQWTHLSG